MEAYTPLRQRQWECAGMVEFLRLALHCVVGDEPRIAATAQVLLMSAPRYVRFVLEGHANRQTIQLDAAASCEMEDMLVIVMQKALPSNRFEVADRVASCGNRL